MKSVSRQWHIYWAYSLLLLLLLSIEVVYRSFAWRPVNIWKSASINLSGYGLSWGYMSLCRSNIEEKFTKLLGKSNLWSFLWLLFSSSPWSRPWSYLAQTNRPLLGINASIDNVVSMLLFFRLIEIDRCHLTDYSPCSRFTFEFFCMKRVVITTVLFYLFVTS